MLRLASFGLVSLAIASIACCPVEDEAPRPPDPVVDGRQPPARASDAAPASGPGVVLAVRRIALGDRMSDGSSSPDAWKGSGFNLDHRASTPESVGLCEPAYDGSADAQQDGDDGIDNAFGHVVVPMILGVDPGTPDTTAELIDSGATTLLVAIDGAGDDGDLRDVHARIARAAPRAAAPTWTGDDAWPLDAHDDDGAFSAGWITDGTWVSGPGDADAPPIVRVPLAVGGIVATLTVHHPVVALDLAQDLTSARGTLAGVLYPEELAMESRRVLGALDLACDGDAAHAIARQLAATADLGADGTQDPNAVCDGISIGLGLELVRARAEGAVAVPDVADPCTSAD